MSLDTLLTFIFASTVLAFAPGPDNIFVLTQSALYGKRSGILVTLGLCTGLLVHTSAIALGLAGIFRLSATAFSLLRVFGALYLLYLAWQAIKASRSTLQTDKAPVLSDIALYRRGIIMNLSNPKIAIFFLAFLPQFTDPAAGSLSSQLMLLGALFIIIAFLVFSLISCLAGFSLHRFGNSQTAQAYLNRIAALIFLGLALKLAISTQ